MTATPPEPPPPGTYVPYQPAPVEGRGRGWMKLLGCGGCALLAVVALLGGGALLVIMGFEMLEEQVADDLREHPVILEHLGRLDELEIDLGASMAAPGENDWVFEARGAQGTGRLMVTTVTVDAEHEDVVAGRLQLPSGEMVELFPTEAP